MANDGFKMNPWFIGAVISLFACVGSTFFINSAAADEKDLNWLGYVLAGVFGLLTVFFIKKTSDTSAGKPG